MKNLILLFLITFSLLSFAKEKFKISTSEPDAKIFVEGQPVGVGTFEVTVEKNSCINVRVEKVGFITAERTYCDKKNFPTPNKTEYIKLEVDEAYTASLNTDIANIDIAIKTRLSEGDAWKLMSRIITSYFDIIETTDRETGYMRTAWLAQTFNGSIVRTRVIVKLGSTNPLEYKMKLVSEYTNKKGATVKSDEVFVPWDRILRKFDGLIPEMQSRLGGN